MKQTEMQPKQWQDTEETTATGTPMPTPSSRNTRKAAFIAAVLVAVSAFLLWHFLLRSRGQTVQAPPPVTELGEDIAVAPTDTEKTQAPTTATVIVPCSAPLAESDEALRPRALAVSRHPRLNALLAEGDLIRRFVAAANTVALGESPVKLIESLSPKGSYRVVRQDDRLWTDPASYRRYDELLSLLLSLSPEACAELYLGFETQIEETYRDLGTAQSGSFIEVLKKAVAQLRATPIPPDRIPLLEKTVSFAYADPAFEQVNSAQKQFMRLGPAHLRQLQGKFSLLLDILLRKKNAATEPLRPPDVSQR